METLLPGRGLSSRRRTSGDFCHQALDARGSWVTLRSQTRPCLPIFYCASSPAHSRTTHGLGVPLGPSIPYVPLRKAETGNSHSMEGSLTHPYHGDGKARAPGVNCGCQAAMLGGGGPTPLPHTCRHKQAHVKNQQALQIAPGMATCHHGNRLAQPEGGPEPPVLQLGSSGSRLSIPD